MFVWSGNSKDVWLHSVLLFLMLVYSATSAAQNSDAADADPTVLVEDSASSPDGSDDVAVKEPAGKKTETKEKSSKSKPTNKVFIPTEEISEDKPVPFPVDI